MGAERASAPARLTSLDAETRREYVAILRRRLTYLRESAEGRRQRGLPAALEVTEAAAIRLALDVLERDVT